MHIICGNHKSDLFIKAFLISKYSLSNLFFDRIIKMMLEKHSKIGFSCETLANLTRSLGTLVYRNSDVDELLTNQRFNL